ncbi:unnamed protein product [Schistocephalus solidus]|uniref:GMC_oxred_C domain-containing protein n=1 Tax=Schistocephalus solidus TaxID=70667 RepID=A0A183SA31_SCHSO|nr:unnamed protein product [Schistocephalus solidus]
MPNTHWADCVVCCKRQLGSLPSHGFQETHGVDAGDSGPIQDFRVRDPVMPSKLLYSAEAVYMELIQLPGLVRLDGSGLRSVKKCRQDVGLAHLMFGPQVNNVVIPGFGDPLSDLGAVVHEEQVMDCICIHTRWGLHTPTVEKVPVSSVDDADPRASITTTGRGGCLECGRSEEPSYEEPQVRVVHQLEAAAGVFTKCTR